MFDRGAVTPERDAEFQRTARELKLDDMIEKSGFIEDDDLRPVYRMGDVFVFPPFYEGFGLPVPEAMASGACVVARGASAMAEVVGEVGVLVETKKATALAAAIAPLLDDPVRRKELGEAALLRATLISVE